MAFFLGFLVSSWCLVHMESTSLASLPVVYKTWVTPVCLLLDTPFGRRSVGALPLQPPGRILKNSYNCLSAFWDVCGFHDLGAEDASLGGTAQSPWLLCMFGLLD